MPKFPPRANFRLLLLTPPIVRVKVELDNPTELSALLVMSTPFVCMELLSILKPPIVAPIAFRSVMLSFPAVIEFAPIRSAESVPVVILAAEMFPIVIVPSVRSIFHVFPLSLMFPVSLLTEIEFACMRSAERYPVPMYCAFRYIFPFE